MRVQRTFEDEESKNLPVTEINIADILDKSHNMLSTNTSKSNASIRTEGKEIEEMSSPSKEKKNHQEVEMGG